jgi:hypothetical protein
MDVRRLAPEALGALGPLLAAQRYHDYRLYPRFSAEDRARVLRRELDVAAGHGVIVSARDRGRPVGVASVETLAWDSAFFGLPMGRIGTLVVDPGRRARSCRRPRRGAGGAGEGSSTSGARIPRI